MARQLLARMAGVALAGLLIILPAAAAFAAPPAQEINEDLVGVYESDLLPSEDSDGLIITVSLFEDGSMEALSDYQNDEIFLEVGSWFDNGDETITVVVEGTVETPYDEPTELIFEVDGDTLINADLTTFGEDGLILYATGDAPESMIDAVADAEMADEDESEMVEEATDDEAASDEDAMAEEDAMTAADDVAGLYISNEIDADGTPAAVMVYLSEDGTAETVAMNFLVGGIAPIARTGFWEEDDDGNITITLDAELVAGEEDGEAVAEELEEPESVTFTNDEGLLENELFTLIPVDEIEALIAGFDALDAEMEAEADLSEEDAEDADMDDMDDMGDMGDVAMFMSTMDQIMQGNVVVLLLMGDGLASLSAQVGDASEPVAETGTWEVDEDDAIVVTLTTDEEGNEYDEPNILIFEQTTETTLTGVDYDAERYGEELVLEMSEAE